MNVLSLYISTAKLVLQDNSSNGSSTSNINEQKLLDLNRLLPHLRQLLSCVVCCKLLTDPYGPKNTRCQHYVCRLCVRGRKVLNPSCAACADCHDYKTYDENKQIRSLLLCYKSLCEHLLLPSSSLFTQLCKQKTTMPPSAEKVSFLNIFLKLVVKLMFCFRFPACLCLQCPPRS